MGRQVRSGLIRGNAPFADPRPGGDPLSVSTVRTSSALVRMRSGTWEPTLVMEHVRARNPYRARGFRKGTVGSSVMRGTVACGSAAKRRPAAATCVVIIVGVVLKGFHGEPDPVATAR
jgi:hypothetical protein